MSAFICPICGSPNDDNAASCEICNVDFSQLPNDLKPKKLQDSVGREPSSNAHERDENIAETPDWLLKRIQKNDSSPNVSSFDNYINMLFGKGGDAQTAADEISDELDSSGHQSIPFSKEDLEALTIDESGEEIEVPPEMVEVYSDFETTRPERKWDEDDSIAKSGDAESDQFADFSSVRPEKKWDDTPVSKTYAPADIAQLPEEDFEDFSAVQPAMKLELDDISQTKSTADENFEVGDEDEFNDFSRYRPQQKWEEGAGEPAAEGYADNEQLALFAAAETEGKLAQLTDEEAAFADFSVNRPQRKWDDTEGLGGAAESAFGSADFEFATIEEILSDPQLALENDGNAETKAAADQPVSLVDSFLSRIISGESASSDVENAQTAEEITESEGSWSAAADNKAVNAPVQDDIDPELEFLLDQEKDERLESASGMQSLQSTDDILADETYSYEEQAAEEIPAGDIVPDSYDFAEDDLDEVPWDLFESGPMALPGTQIVETASYKSFSKTGLSEESQNPDYQQRMIGSILEKIFQIEGLNKPLAKIRSRGSNKTSQLIIGITLIAGICFLLFSGITDSVQLTPPAADAYPALTSFNQALAQIESDDEILLAVDYTPGFSNELNAPATALAAQLKERGAAMTLATANPAAAALTRQLAAAFDLPEAADLGFLPGGSLAMQDLLAQSEPYDAVYLISSNFNSTREWLEQLSAAQKPLEVHLIGAAQIQSLTDPYLESGLLKTAITNPIEKNLFSGISITDPLQKRKLFALWFLIAAAVLAFLAGTVQRNPYQSILSNEKNRSEQTDPESSIVKVSKREKGVPQDGSVN